MPSLCLTSADFFSSLVLANTDGYHSDKTEKKNVEPGECRPEPLGKLAAAVVSLNNETPEWLEHNLSFVSESVLGQEEEETTGETLYAGHKTRPGQRGKNDWAGQAGQSGTTGDTLYAGHKTRSGH